MGRRCTRTSSTILYLHIHWKGTEQARDVQKQRILLYILHAISTPSGPHLHTQYGSMHDVKMVTALAWRLENLPWRIQIPRDKKPRGEADRCCERWAQHGRKQGSISPKGLRPCPPGNLRIILFPPLSLCSHRGTALELRIAPGNWGEKAKVREFNIASKPLAK